jgi:hypothetical protein
LEDASDQGVASVTATLRKLGISPQIPSGVLIDNKNPANSYMADLT